MKLPSMNTLVKIALFSSVGGATGLFLLQSKKLEKISTSPYFREAFKILRAHEGAIKFLGEPIKQLGFDYGDDENFCDGKRAQFHVRVKGPNDKGIVYFWAQANDDGEWTVNRVELELKKQPDRRLLIKDGPTGSE